MKIEELKTKKRILIIGYGVEGKAAERFLKKYCPNAEIGIADKKDGENYLDKQGEYDLAIKSPGVSPRLVKIPYTTATNIFLANCKGKTIGVTGTKGKSTTATLIYEMLRKAEKDVYLGGNIGEPGINFLDKLKDTSWTVLELSSFQLQDIKKSPNIAVILMITSDHLDYHKDITEYVESKRNIVKFQTQSDFAILNRDYPAANESDIYTSGQIYFVSRERYADSGCFIRDGNVVTRGKFAKSQISNLKSQNLEEKIIKTSEIKLLGKHNLENVCAAVMAAKSAGVSTKVIAGVLHTFAGLSDRLEYVGEKRGIRFYNDSLSTIPEATIEAIETFEDKVETLIAGGHERGMDYTELGKYLARSGVRTLILFPPSGERLWQAVCDGGGKHIKKYNVNSMHEAMIYAIEETSSGKICLLSPASASFGVFKNYKDRADQFRKEIEMLK